MGTSSETKASVMIGMEVYFVFSGTALLDLNVYEVCIVSFLYFDFPCFINGRSSLIAHLLEYCFEGIRFHGSEFYVLGCPATLVLIPEIDYFVFESSPRPRLEDRMRVHVSDREGIGQHFARR